MKLTITLATLIGSAAAFAPSKMASSSTSLGVVSFSSRAQQLVQTKFR
jgi:Skp family chaperone for outer membrane proteins